MPLGFSRSSNRSQPALDDSQAQRVSASQGNAAPQAQSIASDAENNEYEIRTSQQPPPPQPYQANLHGDGGQQQYLPVQASDFRPFQDPSEAPARSQSHRYTTGYSQQAPTHSLVSDRSGSVDEGFIGDLRKSYSTSGPNSRVQQQIPAEQKKKSKGFFSGFSSKSKSADPSSDYNSTLGRRTSRNLSNAPLNLRTVGQGITAAQHLREPYQTSQGSESRLSSPRGEGIEDTEDSYLQQLSQEDLHQSPAQGQEPHQQANLRVNRPDQDPTIRTVDESPIQQQYLSHQQARLAQHQQQIGQQYEQGAVSIEDLLQTGYPNNPASQDQQYQGQGNPQHQGYNNLGYQTTQNPEVVSQLSRESPIDGGEDQRPPSSATQSHTPAGAFPGAADYPLRSTSLQSPIPANQQGNMPPPPVRDTSNRRSTDAKTALGGDRGDTRPPGFSQQYSGAGQTPTTSGPSPLPSAVPASQGAPFRGGGSLQRDFGQATAGEQGRSGSPLPAERVDQPSEMDKLIVKYKKVKGLYFERQAQVEQLQNTLANQRLSQSRTSLDDNEYATRFNRLDGAIKEIAFSIRKDWKTVPRWLSPYVSADGPKTGTKEMTAVGRATISRWINDEIFSKTFHPSLDSTLSMNLKRIEQNIRLLAHAPTNQEEADALTSKVVQWRLTTVDGLADNLTSAESEEAKSDFTRMAVTNLTAHLISHLKDAAPQGIEGSATSIVELAVGIASHLPRESRDIVISYPLPGDSITATGMKVEAPGALPAMENFGGEDLEASSSSSEVKDEEKSEASKLKKMEKSKLPALSSSSNGKKGEAQAGEKKGDGAGKVRFAGFLGVEVKGRQWLVNAPVWSIS